jgi:probable F420-dependent oxidoreductase
VRVPVGVFLPSFGGPERRTGREIAAFARRAEELGFDSLWATDHLLHGSVFYRAPWLDPLLTLAYASAVTSRVGLGTSILVMPTRHPVVLAKEIATLQALCDDRFVLGVGTGWDEREFDAVGTRKAERGARTDESIELVRRLVGGDRVSFDGRFTRLAEVEVGPPVRAPLRVWVAGGGQLAHEASPERPEMAAPVLRRIAAADGWIARPTAPPDRIATDAAAISEALVENGRGADRFTLAHENFLHLVPTEDPAVAEREQRVAFEAVMGRGRPFEYFRRVYLTGGESEVLEKVRERVGAGIRYLMLHTLDPSPRQLDLWAERLLPRLPDVADDPAPHGGRVG